MTNSGIDRVGELLKNGLFDDAKEFFTTNFTGSGDVDQDLVKMADMLKINGMISEAESCYQKAIALNPESAAAHNNLGIIFKDRNDFESAAECFKKTLFIDPGSAVALYNLGVVRRKQGAADSAAKYFHKALAIAPNYTEAHYNLGIVLFKDQYDLGQAEKHFSKALSLRPDYPKARSQISIISWVLGKADECRQHLQSIKGSTVTLSKKERRSILPYCSFLDGLLIYRQKNPDKYVCRSEKPIIYAIGDSHCLSLANITVKYKGADYLVEAKIVSGCKAWHLINGLDNEFRSSFEKRVKSIPAGSVAITTFGEIDCRLDEGIIKHYGKSKSLDGPINDLAEKYVDFISRVLSAKNISPIICNVPAPLVDPETIPEEDIILISEVRKCFNKALAACAAAKNIPILDIYTVSSNSHGLANKSCYIDICHIRPEIYQELVVDL